MKKAMTVTIARRIVPILKYQLHGRYCPLNPAKKIPEKKPIGEQAPYRLKTRFFRGPGRYILPRSITPDGKNAAGPGPCSARQKLSII